jgi:uncharacterized protein (DUF302 family)
MIEQTSYYLDLNVDLPYEQAIERTVAALKEQGFGVLTEIDVTATLKSKIGVDIEPYIILGACNPSLAYRALSTEREIGTLLPCNVVVQSRNGGGSRILIMDPLAALGLVANDEVTAVATEARERLERVLETLSQES